jgi:phosphocarrier protein HPr
MSAHGSAMLANKAGLHARPAVQLTQLAKKFTASLEFALQPDGPWTDAKSPVKVMRVKAPMGATLHFRSEGADADGAVKAALSLVNEKFGED